MENSGKLKLILFLSFFTFYYYFITCNKRLLESFLGKIYSIVALRMSVFSSLSNNVLP